MEEEIPTETGGSNTTGPSHKSPELVASTGSTYSCSVSKSRVRDSDVRDLREKDPGLLKLNAAASQFEDETNHFKSMQW